jgi:hypothetical protein
MLSFLIVSSTKRSTSGLAGYKYHFAAMGVNQRGFNTDKAQM